MVGGFSTVFSTFTPQFSPQPRISRSSFFRAVVKQFLTTELQHCTEDRGSHKAIHPNPQKRIHYAIE
jgi:hypothetical protein